METAGASIRRQEAGGRSRKSKKQKAVSKTVFWPLPSAFCLLPSALCLLIYAPADFALSFLRRFSTIAQSMFEKKASMYFGRSAGL